MRITVTSASIRSAVPKTDILKIRIVSCSAFVTPVCGCSFANVNKHLHRGVQSIIQRCIMTVIDSRWRNPGPMSSCSPPSQWSTDSWLDLLSAAPLQSSL